MSEIVFEKLDEAECMKLIAPGGIGRLCFSGQYDLTVLPVNYVVHGGVILFRTAPEGTTDEDLRTSIGLAGAEYRVAFEVDDFDTETREGWSVLVQGPAHHLDSDQERAEAAASGLETWPAATEITSSRSPRPGPRAAESAAVSSAIPEPAPVPKNSVQEEPMLGNVYRGVGQRSWEEVTDPVITDDADAILRVSATSICGTDLHILRGDVPSVRPGRVLGHEAVGIVEQVGDGVRTIGEGDRVLVSCVSSCGACRFCREGRFGLCRGGGGWLLGHTCHGTQAEFVKVPFADTSTYHLPVSATDEEALLLADTIPTGYEVGVLKAGVQPGDVVVVVGSGPVGLAAIMGAKLFSPSHIVAIDHADRRLEAAKQFGADITVNNSATDPVRIVRALTDGMGADAVIEAVGEAETFELAVRLARPGAKIANVGVHGKPAVLHLEEEWTRDITVTAGLVDTNSIPVLLRLLASKQIDTSKFVTHRFGLHEFAAAYDVVTRAGETGALKAVLSADGG